MITSRRDYILRIIDEVGRLVARAIFKRETGADREALESVVLGFQRLFQLEGDQVFQFTPEQHYAMLTRDEPPLDARDKVLLYAALNAEAAALYEKQGNAALTRATRLNALRFALRAQVNFSREALPSYAPDIAALRAAVGEASLDRELQDLLATFARDTQALGAGRMPPRKP